MSWALPLLAAASLSGCVDTGVFEDANMNLPDSVLGDLTIEDVTALRIEPADYVLKVQSGSKATLTFRAWGKYPDGKERDVTSKTDFQLASSRVGNFSENVFYPAVSWGGKTTVLASTSNGVKANTSLTVVLTHTSVGTGVPATVDQDFTKAASTKGIPLSLVYPPDGVLLPTNLTDLEFQWVPGSGQKYFEISLKNEGTDIRMYTTCTTVETGCGHVASEADWKVIVNALKGSDAAKVRVRGADSPVTSVGESNTRDLSVAEEEIQGGLYYWNATPGTIVRYEFGKTAQKAVNFYTAIDGKAIFCVGCHALSLDGSRMGVGLDMPMPAPLRVIDVSTKQTLVSGGANFMAFSPDGKQLITSNGQSMVLHETDTLKVLTPNPLRAKGTMPDWSADGKSVVYAEPAQSLPLPVGTPGIDKGSLKLLSYDATTKTWSTNPLTLVTSAGENNYYPTFSPDSKWVVFNRASGSSYDAPDAALWIVKPDGAAKPLELKLANEASNMSNSWPKFSPFVQKYKGNTLMWITFSSRRDYGLRLKGKQRAQLWMAAIDPKKAETSTDPSYAAFWLPFQDIKTGNHIAQWTKKIIKKACGPDGTCPTGFTCDKTTGMCEPK